MKENKKIQFVCFETTLDSEQFIKRWEQYTRSLNSDVDVTLQQSENNGVYKYIAQHRFAEGELKFVFSHAGRASRVVQVRIKTTQAGGYSILQEERLNDTNSGEKKVFAFLTDYTTDLAVYKNLVVGSNLNIYQPYYENCKYAYILEYFVKNKSVTELVEKLNELDVAEVGIYKKCVLVKNTEGDSRQDAFVWPK